MTRNHSPRPDLLAEVTAAIDKADSRGKRAFDGLVGRLPEGASPLLGEILDYLGRYLLDERGFSEKRIRRLCAEAQPLRRESGGEFRSVSREFDDAGISLAVGILNSIASALRLSDRQSIRLLLSGTDGVRGEKVRKGGGDRGFDTREAQQSRLLRMQAMVDEAARKSPDVPYREIAARVAAAVGCHERTIRRNVRDPRLKRGRGTTE